MRRRSVLRPGTLKRIEAGKRARRCERWRECRKHIRGRREGLPLWHCDEGVFGFDTPRRVCDAPDNDLLACPPAIRSLVAEKAQEEYERGGGGAKQRGAVCRRTERRGQRWPEC